MTALAIQNDVSAWPDSLRDTARELSQLDSDELRAALTEALSFSAKALTRAAVVIRLLEERGEELDDVVNTSLYRFLRYIAYGQTLPEVVERFYVSRELCRRVAKLPIPEQRRVIDDGPIEVVEQQGDEVTHRLIRPSQLTPRQQAQVFAADHIRDIAAQRSWLQDRRPDRPQVGQQSPVVLDSKRGGIVVSGQRLFISTKEMADFIARLSK